MPKIAKAEDVRTVNDVIEFREGIKQYMECFGCPQSDFPEEFLVRWREVGKIIHEENRFLPDQIPPRSTALGTRSRLAFRELELWVFGQGIFL